MEGGPRRLMPELPDVTVYVERLRALVVGQTLEKVVIASPFVLRTAEPRPEAFYGRVLEDVRRMNKRIVLGFRAGLFMVFHLMIAGRLRWKPLGTALPKKLGLASFEFPNGVLHLTEAGSKHRASIHLVSGEDALAAFERSGVDVFRASTEAFAAALRQRNRTLKRAVTDPDIVDGIGNAYSDEILHRARLSPVKLTASITQAEIANLRQAAIQVLSEWIERLRAEAGNGFPEKVTAFHPEMAVHGKYGQPCPVCGAPVQRIVYADNESNYCPGCQTGGKVLADRSLSRLLKADWPRTLEELEQMKAKR